MVPRLTRLQQLTRDRVVAASRASLLPAEFAADVLRGIATALPFDGCRIFGIDPASRLLNRLLAASDSDAPFRQLWLSQIYLAESSITPYFAPQVLMDHGVIAVTYRPNQTDCFGLTGEMTIPVDPSTHWRVFHETLTPAGGSMRLLLGGNGYWFGMIDFMRRGAVRPFTSTEFFFTRSLQPLITQGLAKALSRETAQRSRERFSSELHSGVVIVDRAGKVTFSTPAGEDWARRIRDEEMGDNSKLPTAFWSVIAQHRHLVNSEFASVTVDHRHGRARIEASDGGSDGTVVVICSPVQPREPMELPTDWPLTAAERRVVTLLIGGARNREIAAQLAVAEVTIETHLTHVYEKLAVRGRAEVMAKLFTERFLPEFRSSTPMI